jgi:hypothetical protein
MENVEKSREHLACGGNTVWEKVANFTDVSIGHSNRYFVDFSFSELSKREDYFVHVIHSFDQYRSSSYDNISLATI